jgi:hypothetical protein
VESEYDVLESAEEFTLAYGPLGLELRYTKYPTTVDELRSQLRATLWLVEDVTAVPETATFTGELGALLAIDNMPVSLPALLGAKFTV